MAELEDSFDLKDNFSFVNSPIWVQLHAFTTSLPPIAYGSGLSYQHRLWWSFTDMLPSDFGLCDKTLR